MRSNARRLLAAEIAQQAEFEGCGSVGFLYLSDLHEARDVAHALGDDSQLFLAAAQTELTGEFSSFDDYLATPPVGVQLVAAPWREDLLFQVARTLELAHPWRDRRPAAR